MKKCSVCAIEKEESEFFKKRNGLEGFCKRCKREKAKINFDKNRKINLEKDRIRAKERRESEGFQEWRKEYNEKTKEKRKKKTFEYYINHKEHLIAVGKKWREENRGRFNELSKKCREKYPLKYAARMYVKYALRANEIKRPKTCEKCLKECIAEAHHEDYTKPLEVKWLCRQCHGFIHRSV